MQPITLCPACSGTSFYSFLSCKDHTVSHETFTLVQCDRCGLVITSPRPEQSELASFYVSDDYISHSNTARTIFDKIYQVSRLYTMNWKLNLIKELCLTPVRTILDFGCGTGHFLETCRKSRLSITGVEPSDKARQYATQLLGENIVHQNIEDFNGTFDVITLWHVLEHIPDPNSILKALNTKLNTNGTMFIAVPNFLSTDARHYKEKWAGYDVPRHLWHFSNQNMDLLLKNQGFQLIKSIPMKLDAFYVSMLSEQYAGSGKLAAFVRGLWNGLKSNIKAQTNHQYSSIIYVVRK